MGTPALLDDLEVDNGEDAVTAGIPAADPATIPEDLGDAAPEGQEHRRDDDVESKLGPVPVDFVIIGDNGPPEIGLNARDRIRARDLAVQAAALAVRNHASIHFTPGPRRWDPIARRRKAVRGETGRFENGSSFVTWCLWNALEHFGVGDVVNGQDFRDGFTGTMLEHGHRVSRAQILRADVCFYAAVDGRINHAAIYVGGGMVISHGSDPGPRKLAMDYRPIAEIRRYIRP